MVLTKNEQVVQQYQYGPATSNQEINENINKDFVATGNQMVA